MNWLRSYAFASNAFASYPLHGPGEVMPGAPTGPSFGWLGFPPLEPRRRQRTRAQDDEDLAIILASMEE